MSSNQKVQKQIHSTNQVFVRREGPFPSPDEMKNYKNLGVLERLLKFTENEQKHVHDSQMLALKSHNRTVIHATVVMFACLFLAALFSYMILDRQLSAAYITIPGIFLSIPVGNMIKALLGSRNKDK